MFDSLNRFSFQSTAIEELKKLKKQIWLICSKIQILYVIIQDKGLYLQEFKFAKKNQQF